MVSLESYVHACVSTGYACPTVLIALEDGVGKGSGRSVKGFHLYDALCNSAPLLERFGGHELAAGLTIGKKISGV